jgi:SAM-dependent methyltransferase
MTVGQPNTHPQSRDAVQWELVDEGWGHAAPEAATLYEPANAREYVAVHHRLDVGDDDLLDVGCGSGLALELATLRGARAHGIDASQRLIDIAQDRCPTADLRVGDMQQLPWNDDSFDVVTSFRSIWATTPAAIDEAYRVLRPGGKFAFTVWGDVFSSPHSWALAPFLLAAPEQVDHQAALLGYGDPGVAYAALEHAGFVDIDVLDVPFAWEFPDPATFARALASTGPAYEAICNVGDEAFLDTATAGATAHERAGLPLRAELPVIGYTARTPTGEPHLH